VDRVRKAMTINKCLTDEWLEVHRVWHQLGGRSTCTMMFGHMETPAERVETLERLRQLQDETGGFTAFIAWTFQPEHTAMADVPARGAYEYLKTQAIARLYLDNIPNIQSSWVTQAPKIGQLALLFGVSEMGSRTPAWLGWRALMSSRRRAKYAATSASCPRTRRSTTGCPPGSWWSTLAGCTAWVASSCANAWRSCSARYR